MRWLAVVAIGVSSGLTSVSHPLSAQTVLDGYFIESDGRLIIESESIVPLPSPWADATNFTAPNVNAPDQATGDGFIVWEGNQQLNNPGQGTLVYPVQINTPGEYRFCWRTQVGNGTSPTDHNDSWLKIDADAYFGRRSNGNIVCPKGFDPARNDCVGGAPNGSGSEGWFKVYSSGTTDWTFSTRTSDNDAHNIFARFDTADIYTLQISGRSSFHLVDRLTLADNGNCITNLEIPESEYVDLATVFVDGFESTPD